MAHNIAEKVVIDVDKNYSQEWTHPFRVSCSTVVTGQTLCCLVYKNLSGDDNEIDRRIQEVDGRVLCRQERLVNCENGVDY